MQLWSNAYENEYALRLTTANADDDYDKLEDTFLQELIPMQGILILLQNLIILRILKMAQSIL